MRPVVFADIPDAQGNWIEIPLLVDSGADRTVLSNSVRRVLAHSSASSSLLGGVGGQTAAQLIQTQIRLKQVDGSDTTFRGEFAACMQDEALDMSVLGRDITNLFVVIVDKPGDAVCLLGQRHRYRIEAI